MPNIAVYIPSPATRYHNYGNWSVPLKRGKHRFKVIYIDQRRSFSPNLDNGELAGDYEWKGTVPTLQFSGLPPGPLPARLLWRE